MGHHQIYMSKLNNLNTHPLFVAKEKKKNWPKTNSCQVPFLASALLRYFLDIILCVIK